MRYFLLIAIVLFWGCTVPNKMLTPSKVKNKDFGVKTSYVYNSNEYSDKSFPAQSPFSYMMFPEVSGFIQYEDFDITFGFPVVGPFGLGYRIINMDRYYLRGLTQVGMTVGPGCMMNCFEISFLYYGFENRFRISKHIWFGIGLFYEYKDYNQDHYLRDAHEDQNIGEPLTDRILSSEDFNKNITKRIMLEELSLPVFVEFNWKSWSIIPLIDYNVIRDFNEAFEVYNLTDKSISKNSYLKKVQKNYFELSIDILYNFK